MTDRTATTHIPDPGAAQRRVFHSKVDTIRPTYGFEDVSLAPGTDTIEPADVDLAQVFAGIELAIPILASAMDAVVDVRMAGELARLGGLAILNLEGVQARYDDPDAILERIATAPDDEVQDLLAEAYSAADPRGPDRGPARGDPRRRLARRPSPRRPAAARRFGPFCAEHGADLFLVQSQVSSARHLATEYDPLSLADFTRYMPIPVAVGNTTNAEAAFALMEQGAAAVFVGVGPGAACTTREVLGIGVPAGHRHQRCRGRTRRLLRRDRALRPGRRRRRDAPRRRARQGHRGRRGRADDRFPAGARRGGARPRHELGDGRPVADPAARHAHQGRARSGSLERILFGPAHVTDGSENLVGALRQSMAALGARTIRDMQRVEMVYAPIDPDRGQVLAARPLTRARDAVPIRGRATSLTAVPAAQRSRLVVPRCDRLDRDRRRGVWFRPPRAGRSHPLADRAPRPAPARRRAAPSATRVRRPGVTRRVGVRRPGRRPASPAPSGADRVRGRSSRRSRA